MIVIIPARLGSGRVPKKPLQLIDGLTVIQHTYLRVIQAACADEVVIAVDDPMVESTCNDFGAKTIFIKDKAIVNGTERCAHVATSLGLKNSTPIINVQGDKWEANPKAIDELAQNLLHHSNAHSKHRTMFCLHEHLLEKDRNKGECVKVVTSANDYALMFTRLYIPLSNKHCGIYGYYTSFLHYYMAMSSRYLEQAEALEQMRVLENGGDVYCPKIKTTSTSGRSINSMDDLREAND